MMTRSKLTTLAAAAAVLGGLAYLTSQRNRVGSPSLVGKPVLDSLSLSDIKKIEIGGSKKLLLASSDTGWVIPSLYGYPADIAKIRENLLKLTELKIGHVASGKKLENPALVDLQSDAGRSLATLRLGEKTMRQPPAGDSMGQFGGGGGYPDGRFVSAAGSDTVFLVKDTLEAFDGDPKSWADTQIAAVPSTDVTAIHLTSGDATVRLDKKDGAWTLNGLGEKEEFDTSKSWSVEGALNYLNFSSVVDPALTEEQLGFATGSVFTVMLKTGEIYSARVGAAAEGGSDRYFKIRASFNPTGTNETENAEISKRVESFNAKSGKWTYTIPSYNADNMTKRRADLVKPKEEPKKEDAATPAPAVTPPTP